MRFAGSWFVVALVAVVLALGGCDGGGAGSGGGLGPGAGPGSSPGSSPSVGGGSAAAIRTGEIRVLLHDAPSVAVDEVWLTIDEVSAHHEELGWILLSDQVQVVELLGLHDGVVSELGLQEIPPGDYSQVRLHLVTASVTVGGTSYPLEVPSGTTSGVKLIHGFTVPACGRVTVTLDWDAATHLSHNAHGYRLRPTLAVASTVVEDQTCTQEIPPCTETTRLSHDGGDPLLPADGDTPFARISPSGRYVALETNATNLASSYYSDGESHVLRLDRATGEVLPVTAIPGVPAFQGIPLDDGRVVFSSSNAIWTGEAGLPTDQGRYLFLFDPTGPSYERISPDPGAVQPSVSRNGRYLVYTRHNWGPIAVYDLVQKAMIDQIDPTLYALEDCGPIGVGSVLASISDDGRWVAFNSYFEAPTSLLADRSTRTLRIVSRSQDPAPGCSVSRAHSSNATVAISADGSTLVFESNASDLDLVADQDPVPPNPLFTQLYAFDVLSGAIRRITNDWQRPGLAANHFSIGTSISGDGRFVAFASAASNLLEGDQNGLADYFLWDRDGSEGSRLRIVNRRPGGSQSGGYAPFARVFVAAGGHCVAFAYQGDDLVAGQFPASPQFNGYLAPNPFLAGGD